MVELCPQVLDGKGIPDEWQTSVLVPIFKEKGDDNTFREVKLLDHVMKIWKSAEKNLRISKY